MNHEKATKSAQSSLHDFKDYWLDVNIAITKYNESDKKHAV